MLMPRTENAVFYQLFLQTPEAEAGLGRDLRVTFRYQFYTFSGDRPPSAGAGWLPRNGIFPVKRDPCALHEFKMIDRSMPIVAETEQILNRQNSPLNSRVEISDGSERRFFGVCRKNFWSEFNAL